MEQPPHRPSAPAKVLRVGSIVLIISLALVASPLIIGSGGPAKYLVAFGFVGTCVGLCILINGAWDWLRRKR